MVACLVSLALALGVAIQHEPPEQRKPGWLLQQVFPNPTGDNGFEDLLIAAETLWTSRAFRDYCQVESTDQATLQHKRRLVASCKPVFARIRTGLARGRLTIRENFFYDTVVPEMSYVRELAELLSIQQEVHFAEGRELQAIDSFRDGHALGSVMDQQFLIAGLVGAACRSRANAPLARRLDQLDYADCRYLRKVCEQLLKHESGLRSIVLGEMRWAEDFVRRCGEEPWLEFLEDFLSYDVKEDELDSLLRAMRARPELLQQEARRAGEIIRPYYLEVLAQVPKPAWERQFPDPSSIEDGSWAGLIARILIYPWSEFAERVTADRARLQLFAVHAAVLEYRWWYGVTPDDLSKLNLGDLATDPFTGKPLIYKRLSDYRYELYSAGPNKEDDDGDPSSDVMLLRDV